MAMRVSINGTKSILADNVVIYQDDTPVAVAHLIDHENIVYADGLRDPEFAAILQTLGVKVSKLPKPGPVIVGDLK